MIHYEKGISCLTEKTRQYIHKCQFNTNRKFWKDTKRKTFIDLQSINIFTLAYVDIPRFSNLTKKNQSISLAICVEFP
jgi:hypothetical protein